ncbi:TPA: AsnC family transcriptional regulator [Candidatus Woesearchaeota archaeon]|nr:AsnC family transcriptional regulator [Candidatus Woesearchaeota archaeon]
MANWQVKASEEYVKVDNKDLKILELLQTNTRIPLKEIATKLRISKVAVHNRIKNLETKKIIQGYSCFINFKKLGLNTYHIAIKTSMSLEEKENYVENLRNKDFINQILKINGGKWDFLIRIISNEDNINDKIDLLLKKDIQYFEVIQVHTAVFLKKESGQIGHMNSGKEFTSNEDIELIYELSINSRQKITELSRKLNLAPITIKKKIKDLQKRNIILTLPTKFNPLLYGNEGYLFLITTKDRKIGSQIANILATVNSTGVFINIQNPSIIGYHIISSLEDLKKLEKVILPYISSIISYELIKIEEQTKYLFFPESIKKELINANKKI